MTTNITNEQKSKRIAKNTTVLYFRMAIVMLITLYSVRLVLRALGETDYGIYNVVAGIVSMLSCISGALSSATQRFYSFTLGKSDDNTLSDIFSSSLRIYLFFSLVVIVLAETVGLWFVNTHLSIPSDRLFAANIIYQFSVVSFITTIVVVPFSASVIAHEQMGIFAVISTIECLLKLGIAFILLSISSDKLIMYGLLLSVVHFLSLLSYIVICCKSYPECHYHKPKDKKLLKNIISYSGWTLFGSVARVCNIQGNTILVNIFFGPVVNAARAIALQITSALDSFTNSFVMAIRPPIVKSYAEGNFSYLLKLFDFGNKFVFYCLLVVCLPLMFETDTVLRLWLSDVSHDMIVFSRIILIYTVVYCLHYPVTIIMQASGKVKNYFVPVESFTLLCMPLTYLFFKLGYNAEYTFYVMVVVFAMAQAMRVYILKKTLSLFSIRKYFTQFLLPAFLITLFVSIAIYYFRGLINDPYYRLVLVFVLSALLIILFVGIFVLDKQEIEMVKQVIKRK